MDSIKTKNNKSILLIFPAQKADKKCILNFAINGINALLLVYNESGYLNVIYFTTEQSKMNIKLLI